MMKFRNVIFIVSVVFTAICMASEKKTDENSADSASEVFDIGQIVVKGSSSKKLQLTNVITKKEMDKLSVYDIPHAADILPGVFITQSGGRNECGISVRGFDLRQVPLYVDGVPVYVPYDGYVDLGRFTAFDVSEIRLEKGYSSILYGPNALGGALNLVSAKPVDKLTVKADFGVKGYIDDASDTTWLPHNAGNMFNMYAASRLNRYFYLSTGISGINSGDFRLSKDFTPAKYQDQGTRQKSYHRDVKFNAKAGLTLSDQTSYVLSFTSQHGEKGVPVYAGTNSKTTARYWVWPYWDRQSVYLNTNTAIGSKSYLKVPVYYDKFSNSIYSYDSSDYLTMKKGYAFRSWYDDYTAGGGAEYGTASVPFNDARVAVHYKRDMHREHNANDTAKSASDFKFINETERKFIDNTFDVGFEDGISLFGEKIKIGLGASGSYRNSERADNYFKYHTDKKTGIFVPDSIAPFDESRTSAWNAQGKMTYNIDRNTSITASIARKTRFPTIKDRYSYKLGTAIPNPGLKAENAVHYEVSCLTGWSFRHMAINTQLNLFYIHMYDAIQSVDSVIKRDPSDNLSRSQMQNVGEAVVSGRKNGLGRMPALEIAVDWKILREVRFADELDFKGNYTFMEKSNITNPAVYFTDVPEHKTVFQISYKPVKIAEGLIAFEHNSSRIENSQGTIKLEGYTVVNAKVNMSLGKNMSICAGVNNMFDRNYSLQEGYPEEGRSYFTNMSVNFSIR